MAVPRSGLIYDEIAANQARTAWTPCDVKAYGLKAFAVKTTGFTGTLTLDGQHYRGQSDWRAMRYRTLTPGSGNPGAPTDAAPTFIANTGYRVYLVNDPWDVVSCTVTGYSAGTLTVTYLFTDAPVDEDSAPLLPLGGTPTAPAQVSVTTVAAALAAQACKAIIVQADPDNTVDVLVGDATNQPIQLTPGQSITLPVSNHNLLYHKTASGAANLNVISVN